MTRTRRAFLLLASTIIAFAIIALAAAYLFPYRIMRDIREAAYEITNAYAELAKLDGIAASAKQNEAVLREEREIVAAVESAFLTKDQPLPFIEMLESIANGTKTNLAIDIANVGENERPTFRLTVLGSNRAVFSFLEKLENAPMLVDVRSVNYRGLDDKEVASIIQAKGQIQGLRAQLTISLAAILPQ